MLVNIITDGSQIKTGAAGAAAIIRLSPEHLPIKILSFLGSVESSQAELWAAIIAFGMCKHLNLESHCLRWTSDSKTTQKCLSSELAFWSKNSWLNKSGLNPKHVEDWKTLNNLTTDSIICCVHKQRSTKHQDLTSCDKASRWAANLGQQINNKDSLPGKNVAQDQRLAWQVLVLNEVISLESDRRVDKLNRLFQGIKVYKR